MLRTEMSDDAHFVGGIIWGHVTGGTPQSAHATWAHRRRRPHTSPDKRRGRPGRGTRVTSTRADDGRRVEREIVTDCTWISTEREDRIICEEESETFRIFLLGHVAARYTPPPFFPGRSSAARARPRGDPREAARAWNQNVVAVGAGCVQCASGTCQIFERLERAEPCRETGVEARPHR